MEGGSPRSDLSGNEAIPRGEGRGAMLLFTGLPKSGKTSLANGVRSRLLDMAIPCYVLDGDIMRRGLNSDLGYSPEDRRENIRRIAEVAKLMADAGVLVLAAFIAPYRESRLYIRDLLAEWGYFECYVKCPLEVCEKRDLRGLYEKARKGLIKDMTGISAPYEEPWECDLVVPTDRLSLVESVDLVVDFLVRQGVIQRHLNGQAENGVEPLSSIAADRKSTTK
jgi:adenylylsulfate kinase